MLGVFMHGDAQAVPVWLLVVPFVLMAVEELRAQAGEHRGRKGDGEMGRRGETEAVSLAQAVSSAVLFHGIVIATVVAGHREMRDS